MTEEKPAAASRSWRLATSAASRSSSQAGPVLLGAPHHGAAVRQPLQRRERARVAVEHVQLHVAGGVAGRDPRRDRPQRGGTPGLRRAADQQVGAGFQVEGEVPLRLLRGPVLRPVHDRGQAAGGAGVRPWQAAQRDQLRQRVQPRPVRRRVPPGGAHGRHQRGQVGLPGRGGGRSSRALAVGRSRRLAGRLERPRHHAHRRPGGLCGTRAGHRAADVAALELDDRAALDARVTAAAQTAVDRGGVGDLDDGGGVLRVLDPQADPQRHVGPDVLADHAGGPLSGQHQVDAHRAALAGDVGELVQEIGHPLGEHGELVHDEDEPGQRPARLPGGVVTADVRAPCIGEHPLAVPGLRAQRHQRPAAQVLVEVGEEAGDVRQPGGARERGPALVVDQHEDQRLRRVAQRQRGHQRLQEFALARAGRARDQHVRPVDGDVEGERRPVRGPPERDPGGPPAAPPQLGDGCGVRPPHPPQIK